MTQRSEKRTAVLLATYNGAAHLAEQLDSLARQNWDAIDVYASDDGSDDATPGILRSWESKWIKGRFVILEGPREGYCENFRSLMRRGDIQADYFAFCDQDDIWQPDKIAAAVAMLDEQAANSPGLYCSRTRIVSETGRPEGFSPLFRRKPSFRNAIVQSIAGGNTILLNRKAFLLVSESAARTGFVSHDWWCYMLISGAGGAVVYDPHPRILYRQHAGNLVGSNNGVRAGLRRFGLMLRGRFQTWSDVNVAALASCNDMLTEESRRIFAEFRRMRSRNLMERIAGLLRSGAYRQTIKGNVGLVVAVILNRV